MRAKRSRFSIFIPVLVLVMVGINPIILTINPISSPSVPLFAEKIKCPSCSLKTLSFPSTELSGWKTFRSEEYGFEFMYPPDGQVDTYSATKQKKVRIDLPVTRGTLLREKFFLIKVGKVSEEPPGVPSEEDPGEEVFINDREFVKKEFEEGAAGHLYEHVIYSTVEGDRRYTLDFVLHSVNPGVFNSPPPGFDWRETIVFTKIASTFRLT
ncbi:MAG: hypothetical protein ACOC7Z_02595 [Candidatus Bipolaricaulota bacterium]